MTRLVTSCPVDQVPAQRVVQEQLPLEVPEPEDTWQQPETD